MKQAAPTLEDFAYFFEIKTRWSDLDSLGHVNNAVFFSYDESARLAYFDELMAGDPTFWKEHGLILAHIECDFLAQLMHPATVSIGFRIAHLGGSSLRTEAGLFVEGKLMAITRAVIVWFDYEQQKPLPIPDAVRAAVRARERKPPG